MRDTILIVEDNNIDRLLLRSIVEKCGFQPLIALNGLLGTELLHLNHQNIRHILLDVRMPEMSGTEFLMFTRAEEAFDEIPIHFVSGCHMAKRENYLKRLGATTVVSKPISEESNREQIEKLLLES